MPADAIKDLLEWNNSQNAQSYIGQVITNEYPIPPALNPDLNIQVTDDNPFNEYFLRRRLSHKS